MSSQVETVVLDREFFARASSENVSPKNGEIFPNGSVETETIQKFLSICLKQYFNCSQEDTKVRFLSPEIFKVNIIYYFVVVYLSVVFIMFLKRYKKVTASLNRDNCSWL